MSEKENHKSFNIHKKRKKTPVAAILKNKNNRIIIGIQDKLKNIERKYVETLFNNDRQNLHIDWGGLKRKNLLITRNKVMYPIKKQKNRKTTGPDRIYSKIHIALFGSTS